MEEIKIFPLTKIKICHHREEQASEVKKILGKNVLWGDLNPTVLFTSVSGAGEEDRMKGPWRSTEKALYKLHHLQTGSIQVLNKI